MAWDDYGDERDRNYNRRERGHRTDARDSDRDRGHAERYDDYDYDQGEPGDYRRRGDYPGDNYDRGFGWFGRGFGTGHGAGLGPASGRPFGPDYGTDFREIGYGGRGSDVNTRDDIPRYARGRYDRGPHAGRGPKDYQRSNERIVEDVNETLTRHGRVDARRIQVSAEDGEVTLEGTVDSRRAKRMAEDAAEDVPGVRDVHNRLRIDRDAEGNEGSKGS